MQTWYNATSKPQRFFLLLLLLALPVLVDAQTKNATLTLAALLPLLLLVFLQLGTRRKTQH
jgi:uncharacterized protein (TIGR03382 family)